MIELLRDKILEALRIPRTLDELQTLFPDNSRETIRGEINNLKRNNFACKLNGKYQLHPVYKKSNSL